MTENNCGHTDQKHYSNGKCRRCYEKHLYDTNPEHRERVKARARQRSNELRKIPGYNAKKQKKYRDDNPISFNTTMARCYLRKLPSDNIMKLIEQLMKERDA